MTERAPAQLPPADDIAEYEPVETGYRRVDPSPHREPDEAGDTSSMETVQRETARFPETSARPAVKPKGADSAAQKFDAAAGEMQSDEKPKADILDPAAELPHRTVLFRMDFDQLPIRFPKIEKGHREVTAAGESPGGLNGPEREVGFEPAVWSRNYLDFGEAEIEPVSDGMPEDVLPAATSSSSENGYEDQRLTSAESGDYH